ncbi:MAG: hypothetical protein HOO06_05670 [Bdellovibrionaceae bacterium]|jgi:hypothetical protein|nr:hypothetical protein [Pseudobdellovibrionaceae bacterium]
MFLRKYLLSLVFLVFSYSIFADDSLALMHVLDNYPIEKINVPEMKRQIDVEIEKLKAKGGKQSEERYSLFKNLKERINFSEKLYNKFMICTRKELKSFASTLSKMGSYNSCELHKRNLRNNQVEIDTIKFEFSEELSSPAEDAINLEKINLQSLDAVTSENANDISSLSAVLEEYEFLKYNKCEDRPFMKYKYSEKKDTYFEFSCEKKEGYFYQGSEYDNFSDLHVDFESRYERIAKFANQLENLKLKALNKKLKVKLKLLGDGKLLSCYPRCKAYADYSPATQKVRSYLVVDGKDVSNKIGNSRHLSKLILKELGDSPYNIALEFLLEDEKKKKVIKRVKVQGSIGTQEHSYDQYAPEYGAHRYEELLQKRLKGLKSALNYSSEQAQQSFDKVNEVLSLNENANKKRNPRNTRKKNLQRMELDYLPTSIEGQIDDSLKRLVENFKYYPNESIAAIIINPALSDKLCEYLDRVSDKKSSDELRNILSDSAGALIAIASLLPQVKWGKLGFSTLSNGLKIIRPIETAKKIKPISGQRLMEAMGVKAKSFSLAAVKAAKDPVSKFKDGSLFKKVSGKDKLSLGLITTGTAITANNYNKNNENNESQLAADSVAMYSGVGVTVGTDKILSYGNSVKTAEAEDENFIIDLLSTPSKFYSLYRSSKPFQTAENEPPSESERLFKQAVKNNLPTCKKNFSLLPVYQQKICQSGLLKEN